MRVQPSSLHRGASVPRCCQCRLGIRLHWPATTTLPRAIPPNGRGCAFCFVSRNGEWGFKIILKLHSPILEQNNDFKASFSKISLNKTKRHWQVLPVDRRGLDTTVQDLKVDSLFLKS
jgi:hypothetical protein